MKFKLVLLFCFLCLQQKIGAVDVVETSTIPIVEKIKEKKQLRILQYNIWHEGTMIEGGQEAIMQTIEELHPDIVLFQEVRGQKFIDDVIAYFKERGITYYGKSLNISSAFLSKYPIKAVRSSNELGEESYAFMKANVEIEEIDFAFYSVHTDWKHLSYYNVKGFDGQSNTSPYTKIEPWTDVNQILFENRKSRRVAEVKAIIADAKKEIEKNHIVILGGDFNEPSFLDWQSNTKDIRDHNGLSINWDTSYILYKAGFVDCYRSMYPNAVTHAGFSCNAGNKWAKPSDLTWCYGVDDRERIDIDYYYPDQRIQLIECFVVGPQEDFFDGKVLLCHTGDKIYTPNCKWASDHKGIFSIYKFRTRRK